MQAYKFETYIKDDGNILIPEIKHLANHKVEIFIIDKSEVSEREKSISFDDFKKQWAGFLDKEHENSYKADRLSYIEKKYQ